jgi:hypothetical protein
VSTEKRYARRLAAGKLVSLFDVRRLERYASLLTLDGHFYEFNAGHFWHTNLLEDEPQREPIADDPGVPLGPWHHDAECDCALCRPLRE